ncbi:MAG: hypothetical protein WC554_01910 [Clostridia bacterium]
METNLTFSQLKKIYSTCEDLGINWREAAEKISENETDFEIDNYRFISESEIDLIQQNELKNDPYILGCFNDWFIADNTDLSLDIVQTLQKESQYEALGNHIIDNGFLEDMQQEYAHADGYGHHFSSYDSNTIEDLIGIDSDTSYYIFRTN